MSPIALPMGWLRSISDAFLPDVASIARYTESNMADGMVQDWTTIAFDVPCRVSPIGGAAIERPGVEGAAGGGAVRAVSEWTVWLPALTDVTERDRVTVVGADRPDGRVFEVNRVGERTYEAVRECVCTLIE